jgi:hypothetical protein
MWTELRQVARVGFRPWSFSSAVILTIALCATASAAAWAVFYGILLKPLPFAEPDRLVTLGEQYPGVPMGPRGGVFSNIAYHVWTDGGRSRIGSIALHRVAEHTVAAEGGAARMFGAEVSSEIGAVLGVAPRVGRWFSPANGHLSPKSC